MEVLIFSDVNGVMGFGRYGGAYRVATELRTAGFSTQVIEFFADLELPDFQAIANKYIDSKTLFVGFATTLMIKKTKTSAVERLARSEQNRYSGHLPHDNDFVQDMFAIFKRRNPNVKIVMGGGRTSNTNLPGVDYWVWGAADNSIVALANHLKEHAPLVTQPGQVGSVVSSRAYPYNGFGTSKIIWQDNDFLFKNEHLPLEIARGCVFRCTFCANTLFKNKGEYIKSTQSLHEELMYNYERYGITGYMFCDDTYNDSKEKVQLLHGVFSKLPYPLQWTGYGRVDVIHKHREQRELLLESGLRAILFGIETFHPIAARGIGKGLHPDKTKETLYYLKEKWKDQVVITGSFVVGLPGESEDSIWKTVEWLQSPDCPVDDAVFSPLNIRQKTDDPDAPMSKIALDPAKYGYKFTGQSDGAGVSTHGPQWQNEHMDKPHAEELTKKVQALFNKKQPIANWAVYSRLCSLGYTHDEIIGKCIMDEDFVDKANFRKDKMRQDYLNQLLA
jgi:hypothetical protein